MVRAAALIGAVLLASCSQETGYSPDACPFEAGTAADATRDNGFIDRVQQRTNERLCLRKWGFSLANSAADPRAVADAVAQACVDATQMAVEADAQTRENLASAIPAAAEYVAGDKAARRQALFYVLAERAGRCSKKD